jgi:hypothetical protein
VTGPAAAPAARDRQRAAGLSSRFPGWKVWSTPNGNGMRCATRWVRKPPTGDDGTWAKTLIEDTWDDLEAKLAEQEAHDHDLAARAAGAPTGDGAAPAGHESHDGTARPAAKPSGAGAAA